MAEKDADFQAVQEVGKIFNSFLEKNMLCQFFLESTLNFIHADEGVLFLSGSNDKLWVESQVGTTNGTAQKIKPRAETCFQKGQPVREDHALFVPLIVRNQEIGIAYFRNPEGAPAFSQKDLDLANSLSAQAAGALKNILLNDDNIRMERLAAVGQTVSVVLHEVKNIIQLAKFAEEYLRRGVEKSEQKFIEKGLQGVQKALRDMDGFVYEMLSLTKNYSIQPEKFNLGTLLAQLHQDLGEKARRTDIDLQVSVEPGFPEVDGEEKSLYRAILNVVKNAMEARDRAKEKSYVRASVRSLDEHQYQIVVEDNGIGMSDEVKAKLFQAFFSTKGKSGTGLGLMIIDRTIKAHHGTVEVESEPGEWTRFVFTLPKTIAAEPESAEPAA